MSNIMIKGICAIGVLLFMGCGIKKQVYMPPQNLIMETTEPLAETTKVEEKASIIDSLKSTDIQFSTLSVKGKAKLNIAGKENDVNFNLRIKDKEKIWMSISAIIGEVARIVVTPDSIFIINRLETTYTKKPFSFIHSFTNSKIDFEVLQSILVGNTIAGLIDEDAVLTANELNYQLSGSDGNLAYKFLYNSLKKLEETSLVDSGKSQSLVVKYNAHMMVNGMMFPGILNLFSDTGSNIIGLQLEVSSVEGNVPVEFPFTVGSRFKLIN